MSSQNRTTKLPNKKSAASTSPPTNQLNASATTYASELIRFQSLTPNNACVHQWFKDKLEPLGFEFHEMTHPSGVFNLIAWNDAPLPGLLFSGHSDVVPAYDETRWSFPPFSATISDGILYGRGAVDMKGGLAAMMAALQRLLKNYDQLNRQMVIAITSDEEGEAEYGSRLIADWLKHHNMLPLYCLIGEPTSTQQIGDEIKVGRRGAISCNIQVKGKQGHSAYPQYAVNALHLAAELIVNLKQLQWTKDQGISKKSATSLQVTQLSTSTSTENIIPGQCDVGINIRFSHNYSVSELQQHVGAITDQTVEDYTIEWSRECPPYFCDHDNGTSPL